VTIVCIKILVAKNGMKAPGGFSTPLSLAQAAKVSKRAERRHRRSSSQPQQNIGRFVRIPGFQFAFY